MPTAGNLAAGKRLLTGLCLNVGLVVYALTVAGKTFSSTHFPHIVLNMLRDWLSCLLPFPILVILLPVLVLGTWRQRLLALLLCLLPVLFGALAWYTLGQDLFFGE